ncbi:MAG: hypothetical protein CHACPFDD_00799 [Phycisphaerae bacterium]|nr:hypothetical protein [Phycisphaerae bacterium]
MSTAVLALGVLHPALLGGMAVAVTPIIIHLLSRRRYRRVSWGAMQFLLEAERRNRRRVQLEQLLLVTLRCLAMLLIALMIARPFVQHGLVAALLGVRGAVQRVVLIDDSASLRYRAGVDVQFGEIKAAATRLLSWLRQEAPDSRVSVYLTSRPESPLVADKRLGDDDERLLARQIAGLECSHAAARPQRTLGAIAQFLAAGAAQADVYVLSDFQRSDWLRNTAESRSVFAALDALAAADALRVMLIGVGSGERENLAVSEARLERKRAVAGVPALATIGLTNHAPRPADDVQLIVEIDGAPVPVDPVPSIAPGATRNVSVELAFPDASDFDVRIGIAGADRYPEDDARRIGVSVGDALHVLLVNGQPSIDPYDDEVFTLRSALAPPGPFASGLRVETIEPADIESADLNAADCVFLCNVGALNDVQVELLRRAVLGGRGLVIFLGDGVSDVTDFNRALWADGGGILPRPVSRLVDATRPEGVGLRRTGTHPLTALFPAGDESLTEYVHFRRYLAVDPPTPGSDVAVLAVYDDAERTPAILERPLGRGKIVLLTSTCDLDWNDWARSVDGSYVVTMLEVVQYLAGDEIRGGPFVAGEPLALEVSPEMWQPHVTFKSPLYPDEPAVSVTATVATSGPSDVVEIRGPLASQLGVYRAELQRRSGRVETRLLAVNPEPAESDLSVATESELTQALGPIPFRYVTQAESFLTGEEKSRHELWPTLLLSAVALLMCEQALAWWFGLGHGLRGGPRRARAAGPASPTVGG